MTGLAEGWPLQGDPNQFIGSRHHTVPRFYLDYWADREHHIVVVEKPSGDRRTTSPKTASAETDFYTFVDTNGELSGRLEQLLGHVEAEAKAAIERITHPTFGQFPPPPDDRMHIATFLAFQRVRGKRTRKELEIQAEMLFKMQYSNLTRDGIISLLQDRTGSAQTDDVAELEELVANLDDYTVAPDPNAHLSMMGPLAEKIFLHLMNRYWYLATFPEPALITCDEPFLLYKRDPSPYQGYGIAGADEIWFPLNPSALLILATQPQPLPTPAETAATVNAFAAHNAYQYMFLHPEHEDAMPDMPADGPIFQVHAPSGVYLPDGCNTPPTSRRTERRRKGGGSRPRKR